MSTFPEHFHALLNCPGYESFQIKQVDFPASGTRIVSGLSVGYGDIEMLTAFVAVDHHFDWKFPFHRMPGSLCFNITEFGRDYTCCFRIGVPATRLR